MGAPPIAYLSLEETAKLVRAQPKRDDFLIIDVRTSDFPGGNVPGALNISSRLFDSNTSVRSIINTHITPRLPELKLVLTHCMRSQYRGPMAAQELQNHPQWPKEVQVMVMEGGYQGWRRKFKGVKGMIEGLEEEAKGGASRIEGKPVVDGSDGGKGAKGWEDVDGVEEQHSVEIREELERRRKAAK
ncbi:hypothetical protein BCR35DRAFT_281159 [Leucosporidium creatinivorum]|uniref:Rhodanese domain-containing protein n=1 Tax=Leucosporidium creatinivorum TaxID=106004 RepID=A0A1Y2ESE3_9BASI|nr:hypothetical protein BCR35DRAFT_281159 [Leucosporidium creatinivorum]